jgi:hypothetical protein
MLYSLATVSSTDALFDALHGHALYTTCGRKNNQDNKLLECFYMA